MKSRIILLLSLAANLVCLGFLLRRDAPSDSQTPAAPDFTSPSALTQVAPPPPPSPAAPAFVWSQVESTNYFEYIANLRAIRCPEQTIEDIIAADLRAAMQHSQRA